MWTKKQTLKAKNYETNMPGIKRKYNNSGGGPPRRKRKKAVVKYAVPRSIRSKQILAPLMKSTMRYSATKDLSGGGSIDSTAFELWRMNSLYDPDHALLGHQPRGFDQLAALYSVYRVIRATVIVRFSNSSTSARTYPFLQLSAEDTYVPTFTSVLESPDSVVGKSVMCRATDTFGKNDAVLTMSVNPARWLGNSPNDDENKAATNTNPLAKLNLYVGTCDPTGTGTISGDYTIQIVYDAEFSEPIIPTSS